MPTDASAWRQLVADLQTCARRKAGDGTAVLTVRLRIEQGSLRGWGPPQVQRWHSEARPWAERVTGNEGQE